MILVVAENKGHFSHGKLAFDFLYGPDIIDR